MICSAKLIKNSVSEENIIQTTGGAISLRQAPHKVSSKQTNYWWRSWSNIIAEISIRANFYKVKFLYGIFQIKVKKKSKPKIAFITRIGLFEYSGMRFGLLNALVSIQWSIENVMKRAMIDIPNSYRQCNHFFKEFRRPPGTFTTNVWSDQIRKMRNLWDILLVLGSNGKCRKLEGDQNLPKNWLCQLYANPYLYY